MQRLGFMKTKFGKLIADTDENIDTTTYQVVEVIDKLSGGQHW